MTPGKALMQRLDEALGIGSLSALQEEAYARIAAGASCRILSPTGSGKTLTMLLPLIDRAAPGRTVVVLEPARELAQQTASVLRRLLPAGGSVVTCHGGTSSARQMAQLQQAHPDFIVGTPGRLCDHLRSGHGLPAPAAALVIDEFDKCLTLGFEQDMQTLVAHLQPQQVILASATDAADLPSWIARPYELIKGEKENAAPIRHYHLAYADEADRFDQLTSLLQALLPEQGIVFVNRYDTVDGLVGRLRRAGCPAMGYYGKMAQEGRERAVFELQSRCCPVVVATDLAARGLDFGQLDWVVQYDVPLTSTISLHRSGRTGRWQQGGRTILLHPKDAPLPPGLTLGESWPHATRPGTHFAPSAYVAYYIGKGRRDKIRLADVVGMLCQEIGLPAEDIGQIALFETYSLVALRATAPRPLKAMHVRIKKQKTLLQPARKN